MEKSFETYTWLQGRENRYAFLVVTRQETENVYIQNMQAIFIRDHCVMINRSDTWLEIQTHG